MKQLTPLRAIRVWCLDCQGNSPKAVRFCESADCHFFVYRFGKNPNRKGIGGRKGRISQNT